MNHKRDQQTKPVQPMPAQSPKKEDQKPGQSSVGPHNKTQQEQNEERDERAAR
jgi:hypothetical protein